MSQEDERGNMLFSLTELSLGILVLSLLVAEERVDRLLKKGKERKKELKEVETKEG
jgi:hypothetical protein